MADFHSITIRMYASAAIMRNLPPFHQEGQLGFRPCVPIAISLICIATPVPELRAMRRSADTELAMIRVPRF